MDNLLFHELWMWFKNWGKFTCAVLVRGIYLNSEAINSMLHESDDLKNLFSKSKHSLSLIVSRIC